MKPSARRLRRGGWLALGALTLGLLGLMGWRASGLRSRQPEASHVLERTALDAQSEGVAELLAEAIRLPTVSLGEATAPSPGEAQAQGEAFVRLHQLLATRLPLVHAQLRREVVENFSLLYTWAGSEPELEPLVLLAHFDVVPAVEASAWTHPPFSGAIADGYVWGRGALDDKAAVVGILQAVERLLAKGFRPRRTVYLAFGHDEEVGGTQGAAQMAALLERRGVRPEVVLDEGLAITEGIVAGISRPVAMIGVAEKGYLNLELVARAEGGHASMPQRPTAAGRLGRALVAVEKAPPPRTLEGVPRLTLEFLAPEMGPLPRLVASNLWLFGPLVGWTLDRKPSTAAQQRTTLAPTMLHGSARENVLATRATALVNVRLRPGDTSESLLDYVRTLIADPEVEVSVRGGVTPPSSVSSVESRSFRALMEITRRLDPRIVAAPGLVLGTTDSKHFTRLARDVYRFRPYRVRPEDLARLHGVDERIGVKELGELVSVYASVLDELAR